MTELSAICRLFPHGLRNLGRHYCQVPGILKIWIWKCPQSNCCDGLNQIIINKANLRDLKAATGLQSGNAQFGSKSVMFCPVWPWNLALENNRASLLCCFKLCATFHSHRWIQTGVTVRKRPIWVKFDDFLSRVTLKFDIWPWKTIGHLYYATSSSMHHFVAIGEFKLELQSGNAQFGSKSTIFLAVWPCNLTCDLEKQ